MLNVELTAKEVKELIFLVREAIGDIDDALEIEECILDIQGLKEAQAALNSVLIKLGGNK